MHLLYCDESNYDQRQRDFFVYGGLMIDSAAAPSLSADIEAARKRKGVRSDFGLKFNPRPDRMSHEKFKELKAEILESLARHGCTLVCCLTLHDLSRDPDKARRYGINTVCYYFDCWLTRRKDHGLVLIDRFEESQADRHLREKFSVGVEGLPYTKQMRLNRILGFHYSAWGQSHFASACDIALGSFRYVINCHTRDDLKPSGADTLLGLLSPLFAREHEGQVSELSLSFMPKTVRKAEYRVQYQALKDFLSERGIEVEQPITADRVY